MNTRIDEPNGNKRKAKRTLGVETKPKNQVIRRERKWGKALEMPEAQNVAGAGGGGV